MVVDDEDGGGHRGRWSTIGAAPADTASRTPPRGDLAERRAGIGGAEDRGARDEQRRAGLRRTAPACRGVDAAVDLEVGAVADERAQAARSCRATAG